MTATVRPAARTGLTPDEDDILRVLEALKRFGPLTGRAAERHAELRNRDRREDVRAPRTVAIATKGPAADAAEG